MAGKQVVQSVRRCRNDLVQRALAGHLPRPCRPKATYQIGQIACQDLPQPSRQFRLPLSAKLSEALMGLEESLLHQIAGVGLALQRLVDSGACQQPQVIAVGL